MSPGESASRGRELPRREKEFRASYANNSNSFGFPQIIGETRLRGVVLPGDWGQSVELLVTHRRCIQREEVRKGPRNGVWVGGIK
ncbi:hypothetical protein HZH66_007580 [Vespula vulgaris]|uniref:Uncharacterized protein n=2 Tax=Vespula TaxID=7451 RepID=A0A834U9Q0_VESPE|nr:hypothetical protein HZH66_007580 [Vespula vulgaris]KAF7423799.1 hypothetical protein H0235_009082 [Vespula pensylvanica]